MAAVPPETPSYWLAGLAGVVVGSYVLLVIAQWRGW